MNLPKFLSQRFIFSYTIRGESLGMMRYSKYIEITATKDEIKIESLPPSENAAQQHSYWVYLQVMVRKFLEEAHVDPLGWGWVLRNWLHHPVYTEKAAAPADLLKFVRCKCKLSLKTPYSTNCTYKKMDYTVLQHVDIVAMIAVKTKIPQRIWRTISVKKMTK